MADWFIATEGVKVVKDSASLWPQIITSVSSIAAAVGAVFLTHHFTLKREERMAASKQESERLYISTELVFLLERFAQKCLPAAQDKGEQDDDARFKANFHIPELSYASVSGDWRSLPPELLYQIQQLEVLREEGVSAVNSEFIASSPYDDDGIVELNNQASRLGIRAIRLSRRLRRLCSMPADRLEDRKWSLWPQLCIASGYALERVIKYARRSPIMPVIQVKITNTSGQEGSSP
ncbi:hypothetical protein VNX24_23915 [Citrobacter farmeri]|uniref:hypothetical protein n=1 Tax=Citrobacter farmeri TaxID=67824 RepID=UPI002AB3A001|nr:hypothetical protein [Citrobacter farmeri]MEC3934217.1 hypothetical protein [Citrobacter farmeri]HCD2000946.1 hypothetical protein [Citrobacter farmeri]HEM7436960.1 hypothetical protein [Citrobacter amalonaticus]